MEGCEEGRGRRAAGAAVVAVAVVPSRPARLHGSRRRRDRPAPSVPAGPRIASGRTVLPSSGRSVSPAVEGLRRGLKERRPRPAAAVR